MSESKHTAPVFTVAFEGDLRSIKPNPFGIETPFGRVQAIGIGSSFEEADRFREALEAIADGEGDAQEIAQQALDEQDAAIRSAISAAKAGES